MAEMQTTKKGLSIGGTIFKSMEKALKPQTQLLKTMVESFKVSSEDANETNRAEKIKEENQDKRFSVLGGLVNGLKEKSLGMWDWVKSNWGLILGGLALLLTPLETLGKLWDSFVTGSWQENLATIAAGYVAVKGLMALPGLLKDLLITGIAVKWAETMGFLPKGIGGKIVTGANLLAIALAIGNMVYQGFQGYFSDWDASGFSKALGGAIGGSGEGGWAQSLLMGGTWAILGGKLGMIIGGPWGAVAGAIMGLAMGGIAGYFGGEATAKFTDKIGKWIGETWDKFWETVFGSDEPTYEAKAREFGQRIAKSTDKWLEDTLNDLWKTFNNIINWGKSFVDDVVEGVKSIVKNKPNLKGTPAGDLLDEANKERADRDYLENLKNQQGSVTGAQSGGGADASMVPGPGEKQLSDVKNKVGLGKVPVGEHQHTQMQSGKIDFSLKKEPKTPVDNNLTNEDKAKLKDALGKRESGGNYNALNSLGFSGKYQFGDMALEDVGLLKSGASKLGSVAKVTGNSNNWTIEGGLSAWLSNSGLQEYSMNRLMSQNLRELKNAPGFKDFDKTNIAGALAAAHLVGAGGAKKFLAGTDSADAYGTKASDYFQLGKNAVAAATGFSGIVKKPTMFLTGEAGPEMVNVTPSIPTNALVADAANQGGGGTGTTIIDNTKTVSSNSTSNAVITGNGVIDSDALRDMRNASKI